MTKTVIYYSSGTGNSLVVARSLSEKLDGQLIPIVPLLKKETLKQTLMLLD